MKVYHERTKHFELDLHFIREKLSKKVIEIQKVDTSVNVADIFTKSLSAGQHELFCKELKLFDSFHA